MVKSENVGGAGDSKPIKKTGYSAAELKKIVQESNSIYDNNNPGNNKKATIDNGNNGIFTIELKDLNGDGIEDVLLTADKNRNGKNEHSIEYLLNADGIEKQVIEKVDSNENGVTDCTRITNRDAKGNVTNKQTIFDNDENGLAEEERTETYTGSVISNVTVKSGEYQKGLFQEVASQDVDMYGTPTKIVAKTDADHNQIYEKEQIDLFKSGKLTETLLKFDKNQNGKTDQIQTTKYDVAGEEVNSTITIDKNENGIPERIQTETSYNYTEKVKSGNGEKDSTKTGKQITIQADQNENGIFETTQTTLYSAYGVVQSIKIETDKNENKVNEEAQVETFDEAGNKKFAEIFTDNDENKINEEIYKEEYYPQSDVKKTITSKTDANQNGSFEKIQIQEYRKDGTLESVEKQLAPDDDGKIKEKHKQTIDSLGNIIGQASVYDKDGDGKFEAQQ